MYLLAVTIRQCLCCPDLDMTRLQDTPRYEWLQGMLEHSLADDPAARPEMGELVSLLKDLAAELELHKRKLSYPCRARGIPTPCRARGIPRWR